MCLFFFFLLQQVITQRKSIKKKIHLPPKTKPPTKGEGCTAGKGLIKAHNNNNRKRHGAAELSAQGGAASPSQLEEVWYKYLHYYGLKSNS